MSPPVGESSQGAGLGHDLRVRVLPLVAVPFAGHVDAVPDELPALLRERAVRLAKGRLGAVLARVRQRRGQRGLCKVLLPCFPFLRTTVGVPARSP